jgi:transposase-like protein
VSVGRAMAADQDGAWGGHFTAEVILWAIRWYPSFSISYCDLAAMLSDRGVLVDQPPSFAGCSPMPRH